MANFVRFFCVITMALTLTATAASAGTIQTLVEEMQAGIAQLPLLNKTIAESTSANAALRKEAKGYLEEQKQKIDWANAASKEQIETVLKPAEKKFTADLAQYTSQCTGKKLERNAFDHCMSWKSDLDATKATLPVWRERHTAEWNRLNIDPINELIAKQGLRIKEINSQLAANSAKSLEAEKTFKETKSRIEAIKLDLSRLCAAAAKPGAGESFTFAEQEAWCAKVSWEKVDATIPPEESADSDRTHGK